MRVLIDSLPAAIALATAVWLVPGWSVLRVAGVRGLAAWALAPGLTAGVAACATLLFGRVGLGWQASGALVVWLVALAVAGIVGFAGRHRMAKERSAARTANERSDSRLANERSAGRLAKERSAARMAKGPGRPLNAIQTRLALAGAAIAGALVLAATVLGMPDGGAPLQVRDAFVHLNAIAEIRLTGNASMFGGIDAVVSHTGADSFYPTTWHAIAALMPQSQVGLAANGAMLAVMLVIWPVSMAYLTRCVFPARPELMPIVVALSGALSFFPFTQSVLSAQWPNALGTALLPVALGATVVWLRDPRRLANWTVLGIAVAGAVAAHPNTAFSWLALALPALTISAWRTVSGLGIPGQDADPRTARTAGPWEAAMRRTRPWLVLVVLIAMLGGLVRFTPLWNILAGVMGYHQTIATRSYPFTVGRLLADMALWPVPANVIVSAAVIWGAVVLLRKRQARYIVAAWCLTIVLAALAGGPENALRGVTGFWYKHVFRLEALYPITALLLAAVGIWAAANWLATRVQHGGGGVGAGRDSPGYAGGGEDGANGGAGAVSPGFAEGGAGTADAATPGSPLAADAAAVPAAREVNVARLAGALTLAALVVMAACLVPGMARRSAGVYGPVALAARGALIVDTDDRLMLRDIADLIPAGAVVIADPASGGVLLTSFGGVAAVFQRTSLDGLGEDQRVLAQHFSRLATDPAVCTAIADLGVRYAYLDEDLLPGGSRHDQATAGFADVDVAAPGAFEAIATRGSVTLYRLTACD
ncbi:hypothetical protein GCM10010401_15300 [Rarobacter faecitabidus]|uniref:Uncharacterized protein n=1 Tax=Rarobacter faecitabidus TaxID=13243 RepID=A0A542ZXI2_RARFA|nr:DUF6541 family protein [Rarobacter faecitabidus]TQL65068.1 hypothetical protein FB461_1601 [Rarobacter faecitabidus]